MVIENATHFKEKKNIIIGSIKFNIKGKIIFHFHVLLFLKRCSHSTGFKNTKSIPKTTTIINDSIADSTVLLVNNIEVITIYINNSTKAIILLTPEMSI